MRYAEEPKGYYADDEIDLFELAMQLWEKRWWLVGFVVVSAMLAFGYLQITKPVYESRAVVLPPTGANIAPLNVGRLDSHDEDQAFSALKPLTTKEVYDTFIRHLRSGASKVAFFEEVYAAREELELASLDELEYEQEYKRFLKRLSIVAPGRNEPQDYYQVVFQYTDPEYTALWAQSYVDRAAEKTLKEIVANLEAERQVRLDNLEFLRDTLVESESRGQEARIAQLEEALSIAEAIGATEPLVLLQGEQARKRGIAVREDDMLYLRGSRALSAELEALKARKNVEPFVNGLRTIDAELSYLKKVQPRTEGVAVYTLDEAPNVPQIPIKPRKRIVLLVAVMAGGAFGALFILLMNAFRQHQRNQKNA